MSLLKTKRHEKKSLRDSCRDQECYLQLAEKCSGTDTAQPCHIKIKGFGGMATKPSDLFLTNGCDACHSILDGRKPSQYSAEFLELTALRAMYRKQQDFLDLGLVKL